MTNIDLKRAREVADLLDDYTGYEEDEDIKEAASLLRSLCEIVESDRLAYNTAIKRCLEIARSQEKSSYMEGEEDMRRWKERGGKGLSPLSMTSGAATRAASNIASAIEKELK